MVRAGIALVALAVLGAMSGAFALDFPALTGRVVDEAGIFDQSTRTVLTDKLAALEAKTSDQLVVVTLKSLQGTSIEDFGVQLGRRWQAGQKDKNNGVLLIVAPNERKVRIEVGYGLEGTLTDAVSRLIIENGIIPRFRANDFAGGINRGVDDIIQVLTGDAEEWKQRAAKRPEATPKVNWVVIAAMVMAMFTVGLVFALGAQLDSKKNRRRGRGALAKPRSSSPFSWSLGTGSSTWSSGSGSSWSSGSSDSGFSGGGGSFGGGGASGSW
jgi:uncharacterized protein